MTNFQIRVLTTLIYFPLLIYSVLHRNFFAIFLFVLLLGALHEYLRFLVWPANKWQVLNHIGLISLGALPFLGVMLNQPVLGILLLGLVYQAYFVLGMFQKQSFFQILEASKGYVFGYLLITGLFTVLLCLRDFPGTAGVGAVWFLFLVVGATDTTAYLVGKKFGKTPFFDWISPKKTWEGSVGGLVGAVLTALLFYLVLEMNAFVLPPLALILAAGFVVGVAALFGDLLFSLIKRHYKVKDAGRLFMGHGGVLDRFDGVLFASLPLLVIMLAMRLVL